MKKLLIIPLFLLCSQSARADFWGGDLPLLAEIVTNTLHTLMELERQTSILRDEMAGIKDKIYRVQTIANVVQPSSWGQWKDPNEALRRLKLIYHTLPAEYKSAKSDMIEDEISRAMSAISGISSGAHSSFLSGKELEQRGADASPGVAQKLTASGVGTLVAQQAQTQIIESHIVSLLSQMLATANEKENREIISKGANFAGFSENLSSKDSLFSTHILAWRNR